MCALQKREERTYVSNRGGEEKKKARKWKKVNFEHFTFFIKQIDFFCVANLFLPQFTLLARFLP